jgi:hypothetical protein
MSKRTVEEFVEDMKSDGLTLKQIRAVAQNTYWNSQIDDVMVYAKNLFKNFKKRLKR